MTTILSRYRKISIRLQAKLKLFYGLVPGQNLAHVNSREIVLESMVDIRYP